MSKLFFQLSFFFFILLTGYACAGQNSFTASYPAPQGSYTKIILTNQSSTPAALCSSSINNGAVFVDASGRLETCVGNTPVAYLQGCFNRFCSSAPCASNSTACPCAGYPNPSTLCSSLGPYTQANSQNTPIQDTFLTVSASGPGPYYWTTSVVCCPTAAYNTPQ